MIRAGVDPGLLDEIIWWQSDDLWVRALDALAVYVRVAADRAGLSVGKCANGSRTPRCRPRHAVLIQKRRVDAHRTSRCSATEPARVNPAP
jgi:hypothetical protein